MGNPYVRALALARDGSIWAGTNGGGVSRVRDGKVETFKSHDALVNFVRAIHEDRDGNIWLGTSGGGLALPAVAMLGAGIGLAYRWRVESLRVRERELTELVLDRTLQLQQANARLRELSLVDSLTEVSNRRAFDSALEVEWSRSKRSHAPLSMLMIDIDNFKLFNDRYGHQAGDECLRQVAAILRLVVQRGADHVTRYGGEEFAVLLPDTDAAGARIIGERVRVAVAEGHIRHEGNATGEVTVSVGVASAVAEDGRVADSLVSAADAALYAAKNSGRNRVEVRAAAR